MAILSRGSLVLNTSITAEPSTLGGFPGGGGVARDHGGGEILLSSPSVPPAFPLSSLANGSFQTFDVPSYNINGPGSANYRYYVLTITTSTDDNVEEVQRVSDTLKGWRREEMLRLGFGTVDQCYPRDLLCRQVKVEIAVQQSDSASKILDGYQVFQRTAAVQHSA